MTSRNKRTRGDRQNGNTTLPPIQTQISEAQQSRRNEPTRRSLTFREPPVAFSYPEPVGRRESVLPSLKRRESLLAYEPVIVKFVKNGDKFFGGIKFNVSPRNVKSWDVLLSELSLRIELPSGVRHIYNPETGLRLTKISQFEHQCTYVCASTEPFKKIDYNKVKNPNWRRASRVQITDAQVNSVFSRNFSNNVMDLKKSSIVSTRERIGLANSFSEHSTLLRKNTQKLKPMRLHSLSVPDERSEIRDSQSSVSPTPSQVKEGAERSDKKDVEITVFRNEPLPRKRVKIHLDKTSLSWEDVKQIISKNFLTINGCLRLFTLNGEQILGLADLWRAGTILIAAGTEVFDIAKFLSGDGDVEVAVQHNSLDVGAMEDTQSPREQEQAVGHGTSPASQSDEETTDQREQLQELTDDHSNNISSNTDNAEPTMTDTHHLTSTPLKFEEDQKLQQTVKETVSQRQDDKQGENLENKQRTSETVPKLEAAVSFDEPYPPLSYLDVTENEEFEGRPRTLSLLSEKYSDLRSPNRPDSVYSSSDEYETQLYEQRKKIVMPLHKGFPQPVVLPQTPHSELSMGLGTAQSMIDMILPKLVRPRADSDLSMSSGTQTSSSSQSSEKVTKRSIGIQTELISDHLSTIIDVANQLDNNIEETCHEESSPVSAETQHYTWNQKGLAKGDSLRIYDHQLNRQTKEKYQVGITINEGQFASVKICKGRADEKEYLLRVISKANVFWHDDLILKEIRIMIKLRHQNIMQVVDQWESSDEMCLVMEQIEGSDLYDCVMHCQYFNEDITIQVMKQLGLALLYLHANRIVHRDVRPENIFLCSVKDGNWTLKLGGFSLATTMTEPLTLVCGKQYYQSPEMIMGTGYGTKLDVWAAGVICYLLLSGTLPFGRNSLTNVFANKTRKFSFPPQHWADNSETAKDFIKQLLNPLPQQRCSSSEMVQHQWLSGQQKPDKLSEEIELKPRQLMEHIMAKAEENIASVLVLGVTALDHQARTNSYR